MDRAVHVGAGRLDLGAGLAGMGLLLLGVVLELSSPRVRWRAVLAVVALLALAALAPRLPVEWKSADGMTTTRLEGLLALLCFMCAGGVRALFDRDPSVPASAGLFARAGLVTLAGRPLA